MRDGRRWEHGSDYDWFHWQPIERPERHPWGQRALYAASGRDALRALLEFGMREHGWRRLWVPSYFCQEVVHHVAGNPLPVIVYHDDFSTPRPDLDSIAHGPDDVVLVVNHFGVRSPPDPYPHDVTIIEDHTHDPWSAWAEASRAAYCVASLRKTLPLPDGAVVWSPMSLPLPEPLPLTIERQLASAQRLAASVLKRIFLDGGRLEKDVFRQLFGLGEASISSGRPSGMTTWSRALLDVFPVEAWRAARLEGWQVLRTELVHAEGILAILPGQVSSSVPYALALLCGSREERDRVRAELTARSVYTAILWRLDDPAVAGIDPAASALSERVMVLHCDGRYSHDDLRRVAGLLTEALAVVRQENGHRTA